MDDFSHNDAAVILGKLKNRACFETQIITDWFGDGYLAFFRNNRIHTFQVSIPTYQSSCCLDEGGGKLLRDKLEPVGMGLGVVGDFFEDGGAGG